jgi:hypothetical protein
MTSAVQKVSNSAAVVNTIVASSSDSQHKRLFS